MISGHLFGTLICGLLAAFVLIAISLVIYDGAQIREIANENDTSPLQETPASSEPQAMTDRLIDVSVVAKRYGVTATAVRNWIRAGKLIAIKTPSGRYRIPLSSLSRPVSKAKESNAS